MLNTVIVAIQLQRLNQLAIQEVISSEEALPITSNHNSWLPKYKPLRTMYEPSLVAKGPKEHWRTWKQRKERIEHGANIGDEVNQKILSV